ncbi:putative polypeptide N-acetylgalactosaminyltransferase 9 [Armadillidium nasatum]|uniref:Polypeptide N-acetylgalactosaminyltransferase n=1 Tax=Armadillidium nasatum TaxID=96803 RepID=A0A5N5TEY1_9CRUS|nr:putative polypeptide N-acetylgalactosaminyltransferase 9 [Armadillidium nasatum]
MNGGLVCLVGLIGVDGSVAVAVIIVVVIVLMTLGYAHRGKVTQKHLYSSLNHVSYLFQSKTRSVHVPVENVSCLFKTKAPSLPVPVEDVSCLFQNKAPSIPVPIENVSCLFKTKAPSIPVPVEDFSCLFKTTARSIPVPVENIIKRLRLCYGHNAENFPVKERNIYGRLLRGKRGMGVTSLLFFCPTQILSQYQRRKGESIIYFWAKKLKLDHLKEQLENYMGQYPKVKIVRLPKREGLIRARLMGAKAATGPVLTFLDSHCECTTGWLEPLLDRIARDPMNVVTPLIEIISDDTFQIRFSQARNIQVGGFSWGWLEPLLDPIARDPTNVVTPLIEIIVDDSLKFQITKSKDVQVGGFDWGLGWLKPLLDRIARNPTNVAIPLIEIIDDNSLKFEITKPKHVQVGGFDWGWLEPLLDRIARDPTNVVAPLIEIIEEDTLKFQITKTKHVQVGGFDWGLEREKEKHKHPAEPVASPTMAGGLFSIDRKFFEKLGTYDSGFDIWGGENLELSFKTWMCGGKLEIVPCSHVGHIFRKRSPYKWRSGVNVLKRNSIRLAEVWLDDYKKYYYERIGYDLSLGCKSFKWYLDNIYPELFVPGEAVASGEVRNLALGGSTCLDSPARRANMHKPVGLYPCHRQGGNQYWMLSKEGEIRRDEACLDYAGADVILYPCHGSKGNQLWEYDPELVSGETKLSVDRSFVRSILR